MTIRKSQDMLINTNKAKKNKFIMCGRCGVGFLRRREPNLCIYDCDNQKCGCEWFYFEKEDRIQDLKSALEESI